MSNPKSVLVVGDVMLDVAWHGHGRRMSAEAPVPILSGDGPRYSAGGAANVAANLAALGCQTYLLGAVGSDSYGERLREVVTAAGVTSRLVTQPGGTTTVKHRTYNDGVMVCRYDTEVLPLYGHGGDAGTTSVLELLADGNVGAIVLVDYNKGFLHEGNVGAIRAAAASIPILADCRPSKLPLYSGISLLKPNLAEAIAMAENTGLVHPVLGARGEEWDKAHVIALHLYARCQAGAVVVTLGGKGAGIAIGGQFYSVPAIAMDRGDVVGAGDVFMASLACQIARGEFHPYASLQFANAAAGLSLRKTGTAAVSLADVRHALYTAGLPASKVMSVADAVLFGERSGGTVVLANGCFDGLHAGHIQLLAEAKKCGDWLTVAVNDDASIRDLKGPGRPQVPSAERMAHVAALHSVDAVIPFSGDVESLVRVVRPQVLVKGDDTPRPVKGADWVAQHGGRVVFVPVFLNFHSSALAAGAKG